MSKEKKHGGIYAFIAGSAVAAFAVCSFFPKQSTEAWEWAQEKANDLNGTTLYHSAEEGYGYTLVFNAYDYDLPGWAIFYDAPNGSEPAMPEPSLEQ